MCFEGVGVSFSVYQSIQSQDRRVLKKRVYRVTSADSCCMALATRPAACKEECTVDEK